MSDGYGLSFAPRTLAELVGRHGGVLRNGARGGARRIAPLEFARAGDLAPLLTARYARQALDAAERGVHLLIDEAVAQAQPAIAKLPGWFHPLAPWAMAEVLESCDAPNDLARWGDGTLIGPNVQLLPRVLIGEGVVIGAGTVIGNPGFGWATAKDGTLRAIPQLGGVIIEDDVSIGALCTIDAGTLGPTVIRRGAKLDAQVHVGHNCDIGEGTLIAAQTGLAGSVVIGQGCALGGQVGIADHVTLGDGVKIAAKSGVIGDIPEGAVVAGYPAVRRQRWLRGLAQLYRSLPTQPPTPPSGARS